MKQEIIKFGWVGSEAMYLDHPATVIHTDMVIGRYGGTLQQALIKMKTGPLC